MEITKTIFHYFVRNYNARQAVLDMKEIINMRLQPLLKPGEDIDVISYRAVQKMFRMVRRQIHMYTQNLYRRVKLGKYGRGIEIDESVFATVTREGQKHKVWVLGFYERGTKEARAIHIKDRTEETLTQVILENVEQGAEIYTDFWRGYNGLKHYYTHRVVNKA